MTPDPKAPLPGTETIELDEEQDTMRVTVVQTITPTRYSDLARTRYWEDRVDTGRAAVTGETTLGIGPDDPIMKAVEAAKLQLMEAERARGSKLASTTDASPAIAELMQAERARTTELARTVEIRATQAALARTSDATPASILIVRAERDRVHTVMKQPQRFPRLRQLLMAATGLFLLGMAFSTLLPQAPAHEQATQAATTASAPQPERSQPPAAEPLAETSEKAAVDALVAGDYSLAGRHYSALAEGHPEQPAFAEAARILGKRK